MRGTRTRLEEGIFRDDYGLAGVVKVGRQQREQRYPEGTDLTEIRQWRRDTQTTLRAAVPLASSSRFAKDCARYLRQIQGTIDKASLKSRRSELKAWIAVLGPKAHARKIDVDAIRRAMGTWRHAGRAPKTVLNRLRTLGHLWRVLYRQAPPFDGLELPRPAKRRPVYVTAKTLRAVEARLREHEASGLLRDAKTRARFMVICATGIRPSQLKRAKAEDVDLRRRVMLLPGAKGGEPVALPLNTDMVNAWKTFAAAKAWGKFDTRSFGRVLVSCGWPEGVRRYNARHALGMDLSEQGHDLADIQQWMGHSDIRTTRQHYVPVLSSRLKAMSDQLDGRLGWLAPKAGTAKRRPKSRRKSNAA